MKKFTRFFVDLRFGEKNFNIFRQRIKFFFDDAPDNAIINTVIAVR